MPDRISGRTAGPLHGRPQPPPAYRQDSTGCRPPSRGRKCQGFAGRVHDLAWPHHDTVPPGSEFLPTRKPEAPFFFSTVSEPGPDHWAPVTRRPRGNGVRGRIWLKGASPGQPPPTCDHRFLPTGHRPGRGGPSRHRARGDGQTAPMPEASEPATSKASNLARIHRRKCRNSATIAVRGCVTRSVILPRPSRGPGLCTFS